MNDYEKLGAFFLGKEYELAARKRRTLRIPLELSPRQPVRHQLRTLALVLAPARGRPG